MKTMFALLVALTCTTYVKAEELPVEEYYTPGQEALLGELYNKYDDRFITQEIPIESQGKTYNLHPKEVYEETKDWLHSYAKEQAITIGDTRYPLTRAEAERIYTMRIVPKQFYGRTIWLYGDTLTQFYWHHKTFQILGIWVDQNMVKVVTTLSTLATITPFVLLLLPFTIDAKSINPWPFAAMSSILLLLMIGVAFNAYVTPLNWFILVPGTISTGICSVLTIMIGHHNRNRKESVKTT